MTEHLLQPAPSTNDRADRADTVEVADQALGPAVDTGVVRRSPSASARAAEATGCGHSHDHAAVSASAGPEVAPAGRSDGFGAVSLRRHTDGPDPLGGTSADPDVVGALRRRRGKGSPLPTEVANPMGQALGADLSAVRVHHDAEAGHIARSVQSEAFAYGTDVYFGAGRYQPSSSGGQRLLAHELAHVTTPEPGRSGVTIGRADDPAEKAADATADKVMGAIRRSALAPTTPLPAPAVSADGGAVVQRSILSWLKKKFSGKKTIPPPGKVTTPVQTTVGKATTLTTTAPTVATAPTTTAPTVATAPTTTAPTVATAPTTTAPTTAPVETPTETPTTPTSTTIAPQVSTSPTTAPTTAPDEEKATESTTAPTTDSTTVPTTEAVAPVVVLTPAEQAQKTYAEAVKGKATTDKKVGAKRLADLRLLLKTMPLDERDAISGDPDLLAAGKAFVGAYHYTSLLGALGVAKKGKSSTGAETNIHLSGKEADKRIGLYAKNHAHIEPFLTAATEAGKGGDGFVAIVDDTLWNDIYMETFADEAIGSEDEQTTNAYAQHNHDDKVAVINANRGTTSTAIHESMHRYSKDDFKNLVRSPFNEGVTEYFTRLLTDRNGEDATKGGPSRDNYDDNFAFTQAILPIFGSSLVAQEKGLAEVYFDGKTDLLQTKVKAKVKENKPKASAKALGEAWLDFLAKVKASDWDGARALVATAVVTAPTTPTTTTAPTPVGAGTK